MGIAALEGFSLNAIMAAMATTNNNEDDNHDDEVMTTETEATDPSQERSDSLSKALKTGTAASHKAAENVHFVRNFIKMKVRLDLYKQMVVGLYFTYKALDYQLDQLILGQDKIACMVQEANVAFVLNMRMFEELDVMSGDVPNAKVRPLHEALSFRADDN